MHVMLSEFNIRQILVEFQRNVSHYKRYFLKYPSTWGSTKHIQRLTALHTCIFTRVLAISNTAGAGPCLRPHACVTGPQAGHLSFLWDQGRAPLSSATERCFRKHEASLTFSPRQITWFLACIFEKTFPLPLKPNSLTRLIPVLNTLYSKFSWNTIHSSDLQARFLCLIFMSWKFSFVYFIFCFICGRSSLGTPMILVYIVLVFLLFQLLIALISWSFISFVCSEVIKPLTCSNLIPMASIVFLDSSHFIY